MAIFLRRSKFKLYLDPRKTNSAITFTLKRLIMSSCSRFEKIFDDLQTNPYFKKYANKISKLQQTNPVEFLQRIEEKERIIKKKKVISRCLKSTRNLQLSWNYSQLWKLKTIEKISAVKAYSQLASEYKYITTPIFYVNADPHIGHLYTAVLADSIARFNSMQNHIVALNTGTDEHGIKVQDAAKYCNLATNQYCNKMSKIFKKMCETFNINYTNFIRTTDPCHYDTVQYFWRLLEERNHIYKGKYSGWYCVSEEAFLSSEDLIEKVLPSGNVIKVSIESGHTVEWTEEENYKFQLSKFQNDLKYWLKDEKVVQPRTFHRILSQWIDDEIVLKDFSISRPINRVSWGIPTPNDKNQTIYVWLDALINYLTSLGYPNEKFKKFWPPTVQVIGKDILKFHGIYWPAFLIAAGLEPPRTLLCHSHWTIDHMKMSKSIGNVISPFVAAKDFTPEGLRYFLLRNSNLQKDCNYSAEVILNVLNSELADTFGNLISRCTGKMVNPMNQIPSIEIYVNNLTSEPAMKLRNNIESLGKIAQQYYESFHISYVIEAVMKTLRSANLMVEYHKPWLLRKKTDNLDIIELNSVIALALETTRISAIVLYPVVPDLSSNLLNFLNVPIHARNWCNTQPKYLNSLKSAKSKPLSSENMILFPKIKLSTKN
ncbi:PREDICTED: methionine--tRNA ligase, mitochondrial-like [Ceratosolen solmsi marchali]|uniref:Methionine--tRNA ligase, mitochondrial n=1 Tax=Ceratosolen solmsi marchali TaxID=326594 RepID=A0AAJ7E1H7_9HYME|nr:PREDICTED: methionine--tRNA ligase, mitochondrial-like [Ceratosolen solmsi marchali]